MPRVPGGSETDYSLADGTLRTRRTPRYLVLFGAALLLLLMATAYIAGGEFSDLFELISLTASLGRALVIIAGPLVLITVMAYYYASVGIEWPRETAFRLVTIGAVIVLGLLLALFALLRLDPEATATAYDVYLLGAGTLFLGVAAIGYLGQRL